MGSSDLINLIAAILVGGGTLALAVMAYKAIRQTRSIQKSEKKERLLNEIIEWAEGILSCGVIIDAVDLEALTGRLSIEEFEYFITDRLNREFSILSVRSVYTLQSASEAFQNAKVRDYVKIAKNELEEIMDVLEKAQKDILEKAEKKPEDRIKTLESQRKKLNKSAQKVIEEATKIKTGDVGKKEENMSKEGEATVSKEPTMKDIEAHLTKQDKEMGKSNWLTFAAFGAAVALVGLSLAIVEDRFYYWVVAIGVVVMVMSWINAKRIDTKK